MADLSELETLAEQARELADLMEPHRQAMSELAARRREVITRMVELSSVAETARLLGVTRQAVYQLLK